MLIIVAGLPGATCTVEKSVRMLLEMLESRDWRPADVAVCDPDHTPK